MSTLPATAVPRPAALDAAAIARLIPHAGRMCLLDRVLRWDDHGIHCAAVSHRDAGNPLRGPQGLAVWAGIEYAAQAAAVHGALRVDAMPRAGVLASLRDVRPGCTRLDDIAADLLVDAHALHADPAGAIYRFEVHAAARLLLGGQFTLMFTAEGAQA